MRRIEFEVPGPPQTKGRARSFVPPGFRRAVVTHDAKTRQAEENFAGIASRFRPAVPFLGPIELHVLFYFVPPKSWPEWQRAAALRGDFKHTSKPDADNLLKLVKDSLNGIFWRDDSQIFRPVPEKRYAERPRTELIVIEHEQAMKPPKVQKVAIVEAPTPLSLFEVRG